MIRHYLFFLWVDACSLICTRKKTAYILDIVENTPSDIQNIATNPLLNVFGCFIKLGRTLLLIKVSMFENITLNCENQCHKQD
jgi:hypothetical protein